MLHIVEQQYDRQLGMFAAGLTSENKTMVRDIMVDERMRLQEAAFSDDPFAITEGWMAIFKNTRERIYPFLDTDQYAIVEAFLDQQEAITRLGIETMGMDGDELEDDPDEGHFLHIDCSLRVCHFNHQIVRLIPAFTVRVYSEVYLLGELAL